MEVSGLGPIQGGQPIRRVSQPAVPPPPAEPRPIAPTDELHLSPSASADSAKIDQQTVFKSHRLAQIQQQIADGTYETDEKLNMALDRLIPELMAD